MLIFARAHFLWLLLLVPLILVGVRLLRALCAAPHPPLRRRGAGAAADALLVRRQGLVADRPVLPGLRSSS